MQNKTLINDRIKREYEKMRDERANFLRKQQENLYLNFPEIRFIDEKISTLAITHASRILTEGITPDEAVAAVQCEKEALLARRNDILTSADYHEQEVPFNCSLCQDTGVVNGQKCECYIKLFSKIMLEGIDGSKDLSFDFENCLFDNFSLEWYSKEIDSHIGISPYDNMKTVYRDALMFCENFDDESKNLYFYGKAGTGKTFTAGCIANKLISKGYSVLALSDFERLESHKELCDKDLIFLTAYNTNIGNYSFTLFSKNDSIFQFPEHLQTLNKKFDKICFPCSVCSTSGWN